MMRSTISSVLGVLGAFFIVAVPAFGQWQENGIPVCIEATQQQNPKIISDGSNGAIMVWEDSRNGNSDIYAQRISGTGQALWTANGVSIATGAGDQWKPVIVSDGAGGAIITWQDTSGANSDIYAQRVNASGVVQWAINGLAVCTAPGSQSFPAIMPDDAGGAIITWQDNRNGNWDIYAQRLNALGAVQWNTHNGVDSLNGIAICDTTGEQTNPAIISDGAGGAVIAWEDCRSASDVIHAQKVNAAGAAQWATNGAVVGAGIGDEHLPVITPDGAGGAVIAWQDNRDGDWDIYAQRMHSSGVRYWTSMGVAVCTTVGDDYYPKLVADSSGGAMIAWAHGYNVYAQYVIYTGAVIWATNGVEICPFNSGQRNPAIVPDGSGGAIIAWWDDRSGALAEIYSQRINSAGAVRWEIDGRAICTFEVDFPLQLFIIPDNYGGVVMAWKDYRNGNDDIYAQRVDRVYCDYWGRDVASIVSVSDIPNDQGGRVRLCWRASLRDISSDQHLTNYSIWRRLDLKKEGKGKAISSWPKGAASVMPAPGTVVFDSKDASKAWEFITSVPAIRETLYYYTVNTLYDSVGTSPDSLHYEYYRVLAHTDEPSIFWESSVDSGYSVDNISPGQVKNLAGSVAKAQFNISLHWNPNHESDLAHYAVHRDVNPGFTPSTGNLVGTSLDTTYSEQVNDGVYYYKACAVDIHGNEGQPSNEWTPGPLGVAGIPVSSLPTVYALNAVYPNPSGGQTTFKYQLPEAALVKLEIYNVTGQLVKSYDQGTKTAGYHQINWKGNGSSTGVYFYRLRAGSFMASGKLILLR